MFRPIYRPSSGSVCKLRDMEVGGSDSEFSESGLLWMGKYERPDYEISASGPPPPYLLPCILNLKIASI